MERGDRRYLKDLLKPDAEPHQRALAQEVLFLTERMTQLAAEIADLRTQLADAEL